MTTILVVEDEAVVATDIAQRLKRGGYDVPAVATTGEAALRMTEELHPDLVLMDILLKGEKDGIETAREIEAQFEIPIIFLTGQADESTLKRVGDTSHYGLLLKPIDAASLFPVVEMALTRFAFAMQLKESESRFRAITNSALEAIFSMDMQGNVTYWNKAAERTFGWTADDIAGQSVTAILPESAKAGFFKMLPKLGTHETYVPPSFMLLRRKDGTEFPAEPSFASWKTKEGAFATAIVRDISDRKRAEAEHKRLTDDYKRQARMLDGILSASADLIYLSDLEGRILYQNEAGARSMGVKRGEALGKTMRELGLPADIIKQTEAQRNKVIATGQAQAGAVDSQSPDGIRNYEYVLSPVFNPHGDVEAVVASSHDVTEQKKMLAAVAESETQQKAIFESVQAGIVLVDPTTHKIVDANTTAAHLFGAPKEAVIGSVCHQFICPATVGRCPITDLGQTVDNAERVLLTADGKSRPIIKSVSKITLGGHAYLLESFIDISDRKQMELALLESEAYYRAIFESTATGMAIVEEDMTVAMVNSILEQLTGFSKNEVEGLKPWTDFVAPEDLELMKTYHRTRRRDEGSAPKGYEFGLLTKDGTRREAFLTVALIPGTQRSVVSIVDLTALKTAQEAMQKQAAMLDAAHDCIVIFDDVGTLTYWNRGAERLYGWTKQEAEGQNVHALLQTTFPESREELWPKLLKHGAWEGELIHVARDGRSVTVASSWTLLTDKEGNASAILEICTDITERRKVESALAESEAKLRITFATMVDGIVLTGLDLKVTDCNEAILHLTQRSREEIIGKPFLDIFVVPEFRSQILEMMPEILEKGSIRTYSKLLRKDGESVDLEANVSMIKDAAGQPTAFLTVTRDVTERKKAESVLHEAQEELRQHATMFDAAHDAIMTLDPEGTITYWNRGAERLYGWTKQEVQGQNANALLRTRFPESREELWPKLIKNRLWEGELIHVTRDGVPVTVASSWTLLTDKEGNASAILEISSDITERKEAESELAESEAKLRTTFTAMVDGIVTGRLDWKVTDCNEGILHLTQRSKEEVIGKPFVDLLAPEVHTQILETIPELMEKGNIRTYSKLLRKRGESVDVEANVSLIEDAAGQPTAFLAVVRDITERKKAESALAESEAKLRITFATMADGIVIAGLDRKITDCNEAVLRITQRSKEEVIGKPFLDLLVPESHSQVLETMPEIMEKGSIRSNAAWLRKNGESVDVETNVSLIKDAAGQPTAFLAVARDVTERRHMERQLQSTLADLQRSNTELEQFAYIASHDLQEPLRMITSYVQIIEEDYRGKLDADADEYIAFAVDGAKRMQTLINDLLEYSRVGTQGKPLTPTSADSVLSEAIANLKVRIDESHAVVTHDQLPTVLGDESQLVQVFQNLLSNAIKFRGDDTPIIHVGIEETKDDWVFSVRDNGIGIDMKYTERIFAVFQRLHSREDYPGTGIGLAVVKKIVERHRGRIWVESALAKGSTFYFTLPKKGG